MPIYEYLCTKCKESFATLQGINAKTEGTKCPKCGSEEVQKKISSFSCCSLGSDSQALSVGGRVSGG